MKNVVDVRSNMVVGKAKKQRGNKVYFKDEIGEVILIGNIKEKKDNKYYIDYEECVEKI